MSPPKKTRLSIDVKALRDSLGMSQDDLAHKTGYSLKTIQRWEAGQGTPRRAVVECLWGLLESRRAPRPENPVFKFVDLFAGIGGMRRGFEAAGGECVFTCEWDKHCQVTYLANFGTEHPIAGDIIQLPSEHIPWHDVLLAGFPCQPFSIAGVSKKNALGVPHGFDCDTQGTLFFEVERIIKYHRPRAFLLENVKHLLQHDGGRTFKVIFKTLTEKLGYHVSWRVINAQGFVPQHRERIFIAGFRDLTDFSLEDLVVPDPATGPKLRTILHPEDGSEIAEPGYTDAEGKVLNKYRLSTHLWQYLKDYAEKHRNKGNGFGYGLVGPDDIARTLSARYYKDGSEILIKRGGEGNPRRLTPRECARLMGFDRAGEPAMRIPVSDTQAYKQFGNAVVVPVVEAVAKHMRAFIIGTRPAQTQLTLPLAMKIA
jgi:DNA (cytosine-5)-methyltransferase 1